MLYCLALTIFLPNYGKLIREALLIDFPLFALLKLPELLRKLWKNCFDDSELILEYAQENTVLKTVRYLISVS